MNQILAHPSYLRSIRKYSEAEITDIKAAVVQLPDVFGKPHIHAGLGIRKIGRRLFELRAGLIVRVLFTREGGDFVLVFAGNHDQIAAWLRGND